MHVFNAQQLEEAFDIKAMHETSNSIIFRKFWPLKAYAKCHKTGIDFLDILLGCLMFRTVQLIIWFPPKTCLFHWETINYIMFSFSHEIL